MQIKSVIRILGLLLMLFSLAIIPPIIVSTIYQDGEIWSFFYALILIFVSGLLLWLPAMQAKTQVALVSVDIERDTPDQLKTYMNYFEEDFTAFTGNINSLRSFAAQLNAVYAKVERTNKDGEIDTELGYLMDHSANITILDPNGNYYGFIKPPFSPKKMLAIITTIENGDK